MKCYKFCQRFSCHCLTSFYRLYKYRIYIYAVLFFEFIIETYFSTILAKLFISNIYAYALLIVLGCLCMPLVGQYHDQYRYRQLRKLSHTKATGRRNTITTRQTGKCRKPWYRLILYYIYYYDIYYNILVDDY